MDKTSRYPILTTREEKARTLTARRRSKLFNYLAVSIQVSISDSAQ